MIDNTYLIKAIDAYPYNLPEAVEALNYALSYDGENVFALQLMAKIYAEQLKDYHNAMIYFEAAMQADMSQPSLYPDYINIAIKVADYLNAQKLIEFALTLRGTNKALIYSLQAYLYESLFKYKKAIKAIKKAKKFAFDQHTTNCLIDAEKRIEDKMSQK